MGGNPFPGSLISFSASSGWSSQIFAHTSPCPVILAALTAWSWYCQNRPTRTIAAKNPRIRRSFFDDSIGGLNVRPPIAWSKTVELKPETCLLKTRFSCPKQAFQAAATFLSLRYSASGKLLLAPNPNFPNPAALPSRRCPLHFSSRFPKLMTCRIALRNFFWLPVEGKAMRTPGSSTVNPAVVSRGSSRSQTFILTSTTPVSDVACPRRVLH